MPDENSNFILVMSCSQEINAAIKGSCQWLRATWCVSVVVNAVFELKKKENQQINITWYAYYEWKLRQYVNKNCEWKILNVRILGIKLNPLSVNNQRMWTAGNGRRTDDDVNEKMSSFQFMVDVHIAVGKSVTCQTFDLANGILIRNAIDIQNTNEQIL